jgi:hypothetical protein
MPTWHGHAQGFCRLQGTNEFAFIDVVVMNHGEGPRFNEVERHGNPVVLFDKDGALRRRRSIVGSTLGRYEAGLQQSGISTRWVIRWWRRRSRAAILSTPSRSISVFA